MEYCKHPYAAVVTYPFSAQTKKKTRDEADEQPGTSKQEEPARKKARKEGKNSPKDDITYRKYGPSNIPANVKFLILKHLQNKNLFEKKPELRQKCLELISSSLAKRTWQKYSSALALWERFAKNEKIKGFPALAFVCWCSKNTKLKTATIKSYLTALRKIKFLLGFRSKKESKEMEKIILRGMENIEGIKAKPQQKVTPVDLKMLSSIKKGLKKKFWKKCTKKSV
jgi:hypothetical protein